MHESIRNNAKQNETKAFSPLIRNGKYFVPPPGDECDFKELFRKMATEGVGRPVDRDGFPVSQWTPELLAEAISAIDSNRAGVDSRTVQLWFQENDKGISADNIRWLARIFGCGDPDASGAWRVELSAANRRLAAKRKSRKAEGPSPPHGEEAAPRTRVGNTLAPAPAALAARSSPRFNLARKTEALFYGGGSLNLPVAIWACGGFLWLLVYIVGVHKITYGPKEGLEKQVGFVWAPSWTVDRMVFIPLFVFAVAGLLNFWRTERRSASLAGNADTVDDDWARKVEHFAPLCWAILFVCLVIVFLVQWSGVYLRPLLQGTIGNSMVDWILVAILRPDVVTIAEAIVLSGLANLYSALAYWCYFSGLLLLYVITDDYSKICRSPKLQVCVTDHYMVAKAGMKLARGVYRCSVLGILSATCIKLNAVYLISDAENILIWLINDTRAVLGLRTVEWGWLTHSPSAFMTSFFVLFITCFIFFICLFRIFRVLDMSSRSKPTFGSAGDQRVEILARQARVLWWKMAGVVILLGANFMLIGQFTGFSLLLAGSISVAIHEISKREGGSF